MLKPWTCLLWALLAAWTLQAPAQQISAAPPARAACLTPEAQLLSLCHLYAVLNGGDWTVQDGWDACPSILLVPYEELNATTGACLRLRGPDGSFVSLQQQAAQQDPSSVLATIPDACCWNGVACCELATCSTLDNPLTCSCTPGLVAGLRLAANNMRGTLGGYADLAYLSCSLRSIQLSNNHISGSLPRFLSSLSLLRSLGLSYNNITGSIPEDVGRMTSLHVLDLSSNNLTGTVPQTMCGPANSTEPSPLTDILIANNQLTGYVDITNCNQLIMLDGTNNDLAGVVADGFYPQLHVVLLENNLLDTASIYLSRPWVLTELNMANNIFKGALPPDLSIQFFLTSLVLRQNGFSGTLPKKLFNNLGALSVLDLSYNNFSGGLPESIGLASSLNRLDLSNNPLTGTLPDALVGFLSLNYSYLDIRSTFMSCCGSNFTLYPNGTGRYATIDYGLPRLPKGLSLSTIIQPLVELSHDPLHPEDTSRLFCPFLQADAALQPGTSGRRQPGLLVTWFLDPTYTLYENCRCGPGAELVNDTARQLVYCVPASSTSHTWIWILVAALGAVLLVALILWLLFFRGTRPILVQNLLDMRKRLKGAPQGGLVSIVVTDIQGFSDLMKEFPDLTTKALLIHNNLMRKAMWTNFGNTIEQEGGSFSVVFHEAQDAVRFCLQVQLLLANQAWPAGLLDAKQEHGDSLTRKNTNPNTRRKRSHVLRLFNRISQRSPSRAQGSQGDSSQAVTGSKGSGPSAKSSQTQRSSGTASAALLVNSLEGLSETPGISAVPSALEPGVNGLRVRMGIATGDVPQHSVLANSLVMELAKSASDAGAGGQVLMCSSTFQAVRTMGRELGCVDVNGFNHANLSSNTGWLSIFRYKEQQQEEATFLHMGQYLYCAPGTMPPVVLAAQLSQLQWLHGSKRHAIAASPEHPTAAAGSALPSSQQGVQLYQVLAPSLVSRGRFFGSKLSLKEEWVALDVPYFSAPGALLAPLTASDVVPSCSSLPLVTMVFCMADGGKQYASKYRRDAEVVHAELVALMKSVLRQIPGGYFVKGQDGDLKYMQAFANPKAALSWCLAVQECAMYVDWPASALRHWPEEQDGGNQLLFRGPRLKMGVCEGSPRSILPDYNGRADYLGDGVNQAARFMDAAAHGGQIACTAKLAEQILHSSTSSFSRAPSGTAEAGSTHAAASDPQAAAQGFQSPRAPSSLDASAGEAKEPALQPGTRKRPSASLPGVGMPEFSAAPDAGPATARADDGPGAARPGGKVEGGQQQQDGHDGQQQHGLQLSLAAGVPERASSGPWAASGVQHMPGASSGLSEVLAFHLGSFRFKGSDEIIPMAHITQTLLAARRFPADPPRGKGARLSEARGMLARAHMSYLGSIVDEYASRAGSCTSLPPPSPATRFSSLVNMRRGFGSMVRESSSHVQGRAAAGHVEVLPLPGRRHSNLRPAFRHVHSSRS